MQTIWFPVLLKPFPVLLKPFPVAAIRFPAGWILFPVAGIRHPAPQMAGSSLRNPHQRAAGQQVKPGQTWSSRFNSQFSNGQAPAANRPDDAN
jgi:hypothetical protein